MTHVVILLLENPFKYPTGTQMHNYPNVRALLVILFTVTDNTYSMYFCASFCFVFFVFRVPFQKLLLLRWN